MVGSSAVIESNGGSMLGQSHLLLRVWTRAGFGWNLYGDRLEQLSGKHQVREALRFSCFKDESQNLALNSRHIRQKESLKKSLKKSCPSNSRSKSPSNLGLCPSNFKLRDILPTPDTINWGPTCDTIFK